MGGSFNSLRLDRFFVLKGIVRAHARYNDPLALFRGSQLCLVFAALQEKAGDARSIIAQHKLMLDQLAVLELLIFGIDDFSLNCDAGIRLDVANFGHRPRRGSGAPARRVRRTAGVRRCIFPHGRRSLRYKLRFRRFLFNRYGNGLCNVFGRLIIALRLLRHHDAHLRPNSVYVLQKLFGKRAQAHR